MLRNKLMTACSVAVLTAALYGCSSSSDDGANTQVQDLQDQIAALNAELGEGEELTPEALAALIQEKADAEAALADAMIAHQAALDQAAMDAETGQDGGSCSCGHGGDDCPRGSSCNSGHGCDDCPRGGSCSCGHGGDDCPRGSSCNSGHGCGNGQRRRLLQLRPWRR